jgi:serine protease Do
LAQLALAQDPLAVREEAALQAAVERIAPSVVRIETIGGLEKVGRVLFGTGPTTGLVATSDGYIVSSAFNFAQKPASILVTLADGSRLAAKLVATDHSRMLVLLKVESPEPLPVPEPAPQGEIRIGQWSVAVGRTFDSPEPNVSVGIVSAVKRIWGKAIQTDAKISPNNYGGPLVDLQGRVLGVLVPLSPQGTTAVAGVEWYDSGIGFAIPWEHTLKMLPRWKDEDLHEGAHGITFKKGNQFADPALVANCRVNSPGHKAGLQPGDTIVEIEGQKVIRQSQVRELISPRYAGETVKVVVLRDKDRLERELTLVEKLQPYAFPFLGLLPMRDASTAERPLVVRYVYADSPAEKAGIKAGDVVLAIGGQKIAGRAQFIEKLAAIEPKDEVTLEISRDGKSQTVEFAAGALPENIPESLPPAHDSRPLDPNVERPPVGRFEQRVPEFDNSAIVYVPEAYDPQTPHGVVIHLSADGTYEADALVDMYKPLCDAHDLILVAPQTVEPANATTKRAWSTAKEIPYIGKLLEQLGESYKIDRSRVAAYGYQGGARLGYALAGQNRDWVRAAAMVDAIPLPKPPENDPAHRLALYLGVSKKTTIATRDTMAEALRAMKYPVTVRQIGDEPRPLNQEELAELVRWIDTLDRL